MTPTPRTDALVPTQGQKQTIHEYILVIEEHARQLERELSSRTNPHRGSDFNEFLIEQGITNTNQPMTPTPTPRTDALRLKMAQLGWPSDGEPVAMLMASHEQLERELAAEREQVAILRSDERRLSEFAKAYRLRADEAEEQLAAERALADRLAGEIAVWKHQTMLLEAELEKFDEKAISWWCEYQDLKDKARQQ